MTTTTSVPLSPGDIAMNEFCGISTATYYPGQLPIDFLRKRTTEIIEKNPWLTSTLKKNTQTNTLCAVFSSDPVQSEDYFNVVNGKECIDNDEKLFKVTAVSVGDSKAETVLIVSLSHTLADGFTFYSIYSMFEKTPYSMTFERVEGFADQSKEVLGAGLYSFLTSAGFISGVVANLATAPPPIVQYEIDLGVIEKEKEKAKKDVEYVSTNDVVTSTFLSNSGINYGMMALNMRGRISSVTNDHAGNYEGSIVLMPANFESPASVRTALKKFKLDAFPTFLQACLGKNAVVSNWASFHHDLKFEGGLKPVDHHPLERDSVHMIWSTGIIYKPTAERLALLYGDTKKANGVNLFQ
ncbi:hypothetical protein HDU79_008613 [Rhizoclosmatium sp. JEL0117]|nr:hypothetical protein HDU79_008613 [Rhizoclosmatium sp. JEL0117]